MNRLIKQLNFHSPLFFLKKTELDDYYTKLSGTYYVSANLESSTVKNRINEFFVHPSNSEQVKAEYFIEVAESEIKWHEHKIISTRQTIVNSIVRLDDLQVGPLQILLELLNVTNRALLVNVDS